MKICVTHSPDFLQFEGGFLANQFVLVPRLVVGLVARFFHGELVVERNSTLALFGGED